jgi:hypothetical protein
MVNQRKGATVCRRDTKSLVLRTEPSILIMETPDAEEIAEVIWQRQHDTLVPEAIFSGAKWRDQSIPFQFWNEFLLDAQAVLSFLYRKHIQHNRLES